MLNIKYMKYTLYYGKEIDRGTLAEVIRQSGLKRDEFMKLVK